MFNSCATAAELALALFLNDLESEYFLCEKVFSALLSILGLAEKVIDGFHYVSPLP